MSSKEVENLISDSKFFKKPTLFISGSLKTLGSNRNPPPGAPILKIVEHFDKLYREYGSLIALLDSETGSGKTTTAAPALLHYYDKKPKISVGEPQISITTELAKKIPSIFGADKIALGRDIGYKTSIFTMNRRNIDPDVTGGIDIMTMGIQFAMLKDYQEGAYDDGTPKEIMIVDEAHSKDSGYVDYMMSEIIKRTAKGERFYVIFMSATINIEEFIDTFRKLLLYDTVKNGGLDIKDNLDQDKFDSIELDYGLPHFDDAQAVVSGAKSFRKEFSIESDSNDIYKSMLEVIVRCKFNEESEEYKFLKGKNGDVIIFMPSKGMMDSVEKYFNKNREKLGNYIVIRVTSANLKTVSGDTHKLNVNIKPTLEDTKAYRMIITTNAFEAGVTPPEANIVLSSGYRMTKIRCPMTYGDLLVTTYISISSANQQFGRVGRNWQGIAYIMTTEDAFSNFQYNVGPSVTGDLLYDILIKCKQDSTQVIDMFFAQRDPICFNTMIGAVRDLVKWGAIDKNLEITDIGELLLEMTTAKISIIDCMTLLACLKYDVPFMLGIIMILLVDNAKMNAKRRKASAKDSFDETYRTAMGYFDGPIKEMDDRIVPQYVEIKNKLAEMNIRTDFKRDLIYDENFTPHKKIPYELIYKRLKKVYSAIYQNFEAVLVESDIGPSYIMKNGIRFHYKFIKEQHFDKKRKKLPEKIIVVGVVKNTIQNISIPLMSLMFAVED